MPMQFQLREHKIFPAYNPDIRFVKSASSVLRLDSYLGGSGSMGRGYAFRNFNRAWLNGKKVRIRWQGYFSFSNRTICTLEVLDGSYTRSSMTDFPNGAERILKGSGILVTIATKINGWAWETLTSGVLNLAGGVLTDCCLFVKIWDDWSAQSLWVDVDTLEILDASNNVLLTEPFDDTVHMEVTGTYNDYGYISINMVEISVEETYPVTETGESAVVPVFLKSGTEEFTITEFGAHYVPILEYAPSNLIALAVQYTREEHQAFKAQNFGITEGLTPRSVHSTYYLRLREDINRGCRKASALVPNPAMRPMAFSVLMACLYDMFHGRNPDLVKEAYTRTLKNYGIIAP